MFKELKHNATSSISLIFKDCQIAQGYDMSIEKIFC